MSTHAYADAAANLKAQATMGQLIAGAEFDRLSEVLHHDLIDHDPVHGQPAGAAGVGAFWASFTASFSELAIDPVEVIATHEYVTAVLQVSGAHTGDFDGHAPTGQRFSVRAIQVGRFVGGKMAERWGVLDREAILTQLGLR